MRRNHEESSQPFHYQKRKDLYDKKREKERLKMTGDRRGASKLFSVLSASSGTGKLSTTSPTLPFICQLQESTQITEQHKDPFLLSAIDQFHVFESSSVCTLNCRNRRKANPSSCRRM
jgi:hypothetical protein